VAKLSAGLLVHRGSGAALEVLLVHPGGPFWARKDDGAWSIPKGEYAAGDDPLAAARREFGEELGASPPEGPALELGEVRQAGGKQVVAWAVPGDLDVGAITSNTFELEWPPKSGRVQAFPEVDRAAWFPVAEARVKLLAGQHPFLDRLVAALDAEP
jgi:predicted NUDIX family NTP pyrophosphohydrolase